MNTTMLITIALTPFWWGMGLLALALLGDLSPWWRPRVSRLGLFGEIRRSERTEERGGSEDP